MFVAHLARSLYLLLVLPTVSIQVDIILANAAMIVTCPNIPPGVCCSLGNQPLALIRRVTFHHLTIFDIAAVWGGRPRDDYYRHGIAGCSGTLKESGRGPGVFEYEQLFAGVSGASYIRLPQALPPGQNTVSALDIEGILGLVWGGGRWFVSTAADRLLSGGSRSLSRKGRRDIRSPEKGTVYARPPRRAVYPTFITVNGTEYSDGGAGNLIYTDETGKTLDLPDWF
ncbi:MAG: hypothetical protein Q9181_003318 [Wetmoreana brouardii]